MVTVMGMAIVIRLFHIMYLLELESSIFGGFCNFVIIFSCNDRKSAMVMANMFKSIIDGNVDSFCFRFGGNTIMKNAEISTTLNIKIHTFTQNLIDTNSPIQ